MRLAHALHPCMQLLTSPSAPLTSALYGCCCAFGSCALGLKGGRFDPLGFAEAGDLEELKIKELKHSRLSMFAWLGCIFQALATQEGPIANWQSHVADPIHSNVLTNAAKGFSFY